MALISMKMLRPFVKKLWILSNMMSLPKCCLKMIRLLRLSKKSTQTGSVVWVLGRFRVNSLAEIHNKRVKDLMYRRLRRS
ncbi:hypothetical protein PIB30_076525 [Stylosanthes scabra]|uniref:Uncharacterized protein n=1 Tax=Stylosanthes scabra TaxID=79078 RepID=A0ABU6VS90_9FABA|nr:hypothetical protein [Stylosanthes scabra]